MKPIEFKHQNVIIAEDQEEYDNLPALKFYDEKGTMVTCIGLSFKERVRLLFAGRIWVSELTFNKSITPRFMSTIRKEVYSTAGERGDPN